jgi:hypothetical protein
MSRTASSQMFTNWLLSRKKKITCLTNEKEKRVILKRLSFQTHVNVNTCQNAALSPFD